MSDAPRVVVVGAGIAGLVAAYHLTRSGPAGLRVTVVDGATRIGGKLAVSEVAGVPVDAGAEAFLVRTPEVTQLLAELGATADLTHPAAISAAIAADGKLYPMPKRTMLGVPSDVDAAASSGLFSAETIDALRRDLDQPGPLATDDAAVAEFVGGRLGSEVVDRLVEPLLGGVYAGRADRLSVAATMPALFAASQRNGSLVAAARAAVGPAAVSTVDRPVFGTLVGGLGLLPALVARSGVDDIVLGTPIREIARSDGGFRLVGGPVPRPVVLHADAVIIAAPAAKAAAMLGSVAPDASVALSEVESASVALVTMAFEVERMARPLPEGSGFLVPASQGRLVKAATFLSQKWRHVGRGSGLTFVRASVGRAGDEHALHRDDIDLVAAVRADLTELIGLDASPVDTRVTRWGGGLPQYDVGHLGRIARVRAAVEAVPGLAVCGAVYEGVGVPACIRTGRAAADRILAGLDRHT